MKIANSRGKAGLMTGSVAAALLCGLAALSMGGATAAKSPKATKPVAAAGLNVPAGNYLYLVFSNGAEGRDAEVGPFYDGHMGTIAKLPGFVSSQRFVMKARPGKADPPYRYLAVYEIKGDPETVLGEIGPATKAGLVVPFDRNLMVKAENALYEPARPPFPGPAGK